MAWSPGGGDRAVVDVAGLDALIMALADASYDVRGPVVRSGAIEPGPLGGVVDLPRGMRDEQAPGRYDLSDTAGGAFFDWSSSARSWKAELFPPEEELWRARQEPGGNVTFLSTPKASRREPLPLAILGLRPCDFAALGVTDRVFAGAAVPDPRYRRRRDTAFMAVVECGSPGGTCFCSSMGTGPGCEGTDAAPDLVLTEIASGTVADHRFLVRVVSDRGAEVMAAVPTRKATEADRSEREAILSRAAARMGRRLVTEGLPELLLANLDHERWSEVARRCLACGNCTSACPTCFCADVRDTTELSGQVVRRRRWASCFDREHSYLHGGAVRASTSSRYRQWMTHKLATWWDQFGQSGCVGCGRCITWCPVGIDITEEAAALRGAALPAGGGAA